MQEINNLIIGEPTSEQLSDPTSAFSDSSQVPFDFWLNKNIKNYNVIRFKMNHNSPLASLISVANLDAAFWKCWTKCILKILHIIRKY